MLVGSSVLGINLHLEQRVILSRWSREEFIVDNTFIVMTNREKARTEDICRSVQEEWSDLVGI